MATHLHVRSAYTLLNSTLRISDIIEYAKKYRLTSIALVDKNVMHGAMSFYYACKKANIKPIFGLEIEAMYQNEMYSFIVYARNDAGYKQLLKLSTFINTNNETLTWEKLLTYDEGLIIATSGDHDRLQSMLLNDELDKLQETLVVFSRSFKHFCVAISMNDSGLLNIKNNILKNICKSLDLFTFALSRIYYGEIEEEEAYKALCAISQQKDLEDPNLVYSSKRYFRTMEEMHKLYSEEDLWNAEKIAEACNVNMKFEKASLPTFKNRFGVDSNTYLRSLCKKGLEKRLDGRLNREYVNRLTYELDVIIKMGYADYFLIVYDFIRYAKSKGIYVGPGRGSAAGSLVAYCLGITHVDPLEYDLLFERFLNPERISMPDIDVDFPDDKRDEVIAYVRDLYGEDRVAHIVTFGTLGAKQVLRDVGRVMKIPVREIDMLSKMIPNAPKITLDYALENNGKFKQAIYASRKYMQLLNICKQIEGLPRHTSTHAAGIVFSEKAIEEVCPLIRVEADMCSTQYSMEYLEDLGLIKMDFLGLRNLTIIDEVCTHVKEVMHKPLDIMKIPLDDAKTYQLISNVDTMGVFQLESDGMKNLLRKIKPKQFEDIVAAIALFRPGPMENIPLYLENKEHPDRIDYLHPSLKKVLSHTYGIMIYQEQVMQVVQVMAGFSLAKADILRKAISKKKSEELKNLEQEFIAGSLKNGYSRELAQKVYDMIMKFAGYGFNRSHSVAYGLVAYQLAYLKANYPLSYFTSLLNSVIGSERKTSEYIFEARRRGIKVLSPSVNQVALKYGMEEGCLRFPYLNVKNVGSAAACEIWKERKERGPFLDYFDFVARISTRKISRKVIESLIEAGALDEFKVGRMSMKASLDDALRYASLVSVEEDEQIRIDLQLVSKPPMTIAKEDPFIISENEKNVLGFYLSKHPIMELRSLYTNAFPLISLANKMGYVSIVCFVERVKEHRTKNGDMMAFLSVSDESGKFDVVCMPNIYRNKIELLKRGNYLYMEGKIDKPGSMLVNRVDKVDLKKG